MKSKRYLILFVFIAVAIGVLFSTGIIGGSSQVNQSAKENDVIHVVTTMKDTVKIGLSKNEIKKIYGNDYILVNHNGDLENEEDEYWMYRLLSDPEYKSNVPDHVIDREGFRSGKIGVQLFIGWKNERISLYTIQYLGKDNNLYMYGNVNGEISEDIVD
ncbi:hypothetical protein NDK47_02420 [Brevibacillus ruminantium]|uniref:DUF5590 domain-containing protein n=1 Tax=Brevibacillus ruminantium TaxID=2950604 RepID=A0ABY4WHM4_9BACL|nr:hypothetical protein [Brevibacillus ruminantium]USG66209.1 hypothetical protein NDK47_02420 [Brevibacillus ruminantium]